MRLILLTLFVALSVFSAQSATVFELLQNENFTDIVNFLNGPGSQYRDLLNGTSDVTFFAAKGTVDAANFGYYIVNGSLAQADFKAGLVVETNLQIGTTGVFQRAKFANVSEVMGASITNYESADDGALVTVDKALVPPAVTIVDIAKSGAATLAGLIVEANISLPAFATVFAPNDAAWNTTDVRVQYLTSGKATKEDLATVITYHATTEAYYSAEGPKTLTTLNGQTEDVTVNGTTAKYGTATIVAADILAEDGVVHVIDTVQFPANFEYTALMWLATQEDFQNFYKAVKATTDESIKACLEATAKCTILVPEDKEFKDANVSDAELQYYFIQGNLDLAKEIGAVPTLLPLANYTFQRIDVETKEDGNNTEIKVGGADATRQGEGLLPADTSLYTIDNDLKAPSDSVAELVVSNDALSTLATLVGLVDKNDTFYKTVLDKDAMNFTVFAPLNSGFAALDAPYVTLVTEDAKKLETVLDAHVVPGIYFASDIVNALVLGGGSITLTTISGVTLTVTLNANTSVISISAGVNSADVVAVDFLANNGVAHALNAVIVPPTFTVSNLELLSGMNATTYIGLLSVANLLEVNETKYNLTTGKYIFFAPNEQAFENTDKSVIDTNDTKALQPLLLRHIVVQTVNDTADFEIKNNSCYKTLSDESICSYTDDYETWELYLQTNGTEYKHQIIAKPVVNGSTSLRPWQTIPKNSYGLELFGVLGEKSKESKKGLGSTEIGLIVAGCIVAVLLAGAAVGGAVWYYRKNSNKDYEEI